MPITCQSAGSNSARNRGVEKWVRAHRAEKISAFWPQKKRGFSLCVIWVLCTSPVKQSGFDDGAFVLWVNRIDQRGGAGTNCSTSLDTPIYSSPPMHIPSTLPREQAYTFLVMGKSRLVHVPTSAVSSSRVRHAKTCPQPAVQ